MTPGAIAAWKEKRQTGKTPNRKTSDFHLSRLASFLAGQKTRTRSKPLNGFVVEFSPRAASRTISRFVRGSRLRFRYGDRPHVGEDASRETDGFLFHHAMQSQERRVFPRLSGKFRNAGDRQ
jgi:hypothetical protein